MDFQETSHMTRSILLCLLALAPVATLASEMQADASRAAADSEASARYRVRWAVSLDARGHVVNLESGDTLVDAARAPIEEAIRRWQFVPGRLNGQPAPTETILTLDIALVPVAGDKFVVRIDDARTGGALAIKGIRKPPKYPPSAIQHHVQGMVVLKVDYDADGRVVSAKPHENAPKVAPELVRSAEHAVKEWTFTPEVVGGHAVAGSAIVPTCFEIVPHGTPLRMQCDWTPPGARAAVHDNEAFALEPAARLETDVIGHTL